MPFTRSATNCRALYPFAFAAATLAAALAALPGPGRAITIIHGTGEGQAPGGRDANWDIVALPSPLNTTLDTPPYDAYVTTNASEVWVGSGCTSGCVAANQIPQAGINFNGITNYWVAPRNDIAAIVNNVGPQNPATWYHWILKQSFTVTQPNFYDFNFKGAGDNRLEFYVNGTVDTSVPLRPTITGGTAMTVTGPNNPLSLSTYSGSVFLTAGVHSAYMVLVDRGNFTGAIIQQSSFDISPPRVPGPIPILGAVAAFGASRRIRRRLGAGVSAEASARPGSVRHG
jgi:hypothetical protein